MQIHDEKIMRRGGEAIVVPVGMSPVHSLRLVKSLAKCDFDLMVLAVSNETQETGSSVLQVVGDSITETKCISFSRVKGLVSKNPEIKKWNLFIGPGTRSMAITLWSDLVKSVGEAPTIWVDHRRKTKMGKGKPIDGENIINLDNRRESYKIKQIEEVDACAVYGINLEDFGDIGELAWNASYSMFHYNIEVPKDAAGMSVMKARKWEEKVVKKVKILREIIGRHALKISRSRVPSRPRHWIRVGERLEDFGITGGVK